MKKAVNPDPLLIAFIIILTLWQFFWKGVALWRASRLKQINWFIALFILVPLNDLGISALVYLFWFSKKRMKLHEIKSWIKREN